MEKLCWVIFLPQVLGAQGCPAGVSLDGRALPWRFGISSSHHPRMFPPPLSKLGLPVETPALGEIRPEPTDATNNGIGRAPCHSQMGSFSR